MDFSWSYSENMFRLAARGSYFPENSAADAKEYCSYSAILRFDVAPGECEIPTLIKDIIRDIIREDIPEEGVTVAVPLFTDRYSKTCAGADAMIKYFIRNNSGRVSKVETAKGEVYYGNNGIILDKDFNPLLVITEHISCTPSLIATNKYGYNVYVHPNIFTDDTKVLNKSLARKGIPYYLSYTASIGWGNPEVPYKVIIDDCSRFIMKPHKPEIGKISNAGFNEVLKDNISDVLTQIANDYRRNF